MSVHTYLKWTILFTVVILSDPAESIDCYQCTSTDTNNPYQCTEFMTGYEDIKPKPCNETYGAKYCIKFTGRHEGGLETKRSCSSLDHGNYCIYGNQNGDLLDYRSCWYTCSSDGCNSATRRGPSVLQVLISIGLLAKVFI